MKTKLLIFAAVSCFAAYAHAISVFYDDFNSENGGSGQSNYTGFENWTVSTGTVDLIGNGYFDLFPGNGLFVDLDGSTNSAGTLTSKLLNLGPGDYTLYYSLAGNQRSNSDDTVNVGVEIGLASASHTLGYQQGLTGYHLDFTLAALTDVQIVFEALGGDNIGLILDDVNLVWNEAPSNRVPDAGATGAMLLLAVLGLVAGRKRMQR